MDAANEKAKQDSRGILESARIAAQTQRERLISSASMNVKLEVLRVKQDIIEEAFKKANYCLVSMGKEDYRSLIRKMILNCAQTGEEEILISKDETRLDHGFIDEINKHSKGEGKRGNLKLVKSDFENNGGFILKGEKVIINNIFAVLLAQMKPQIQKEIAEALFK